ncbi:MAG: DUF6531 domain-containing protein, partial [Vibrio sp.]
MAKHARAVAVLGKIEKIVKIVQKDAEDNIALIKKLSTSGKGDFNRSQKKSQRVNDVTQEGASAQKRKGQSHSEITEKQSRDQENSPATNQNGDSTQAEKNTCTNGCPVSMVTGEELLALDDVSLPSVINFTFKRTYRTSAVELNDGLGFGWSHSLSHQLTFADGKVHWRNDENATVVLPEPSTTRPAIYNLMGGAAVFLGDKPNEYIVAAPDSNFLHFERESDTGYLSKISDNYGNTLLITRDRLKRPQAVINPTGIALWLDYQHDCISRIELRTFSDDDSGQRQWHTERVLRRYHYDQAGHLIAERNEANEGEDYTYDSEHVITLRRMAGGIEFYWQWENEGKDVRCVRHWSNTGYDAQYNWNDDEHSVEVVYPDGSSAAYQHDDNAKLLSSTDPDGAQSAQEYDESGHLVREVDPLGNETLHTYDDAGFRASTTDPEGNVTQFSYLQGKIFKVTKGKAKWRFFHNYEGDLTEKKDPAGYTTLYTYNEQGNLSKITYPDGSEHTLSWNRLGMLIGETLPDGSTTRYRHDIS